MTRDDLLTKLAMEVAEWPETCPDMRLPKLPRGCYWRRGMMTKQWLAWPERDANGGGKGIGKSDWQKVREELKRCPTDWHDSGVITDWHDAQDALAEAWKAGEGRIDRIAQSDASGDHYAEDCDSESALSQALGGMEPGRIEYASTTDRFINPTSPFAKQARYQDAKGDDWIDEFARTATPEEFRGAMRFTVGKYNRRAGKKDELVAEIRKMHDYCGRWLAYEEGRE